jgi:hypothetical protein
MLVATRWSHHAGKRHPSVPSQGEPRRAVFRRVRTAECAVTRANAANAQVGRLMALDA